MRKALKLKCLIFILVHIFFAHNFPLCLIHQITNELTISFYNCINTLYRCLKVVSWRFFLKHFIFVCRFWENDRGKRKTKETNQLGEEAKRPTRFRLTLLFFWPPSLPPSQSPNPSRLDLAIQSTPTLPAEISAANVPVAAAAALTTRPLHIASRQLALPLSARDVAATRESAGRRPWAARPTAPSARRYSPTSSPSSTTRSSASRVSLTRLSPGQISREICLVILQFTVELQFLRWFFFVLT